MSIIPRPVPVLKQTPSHGWVYIIRADSGHYKIGKSKRPDKRVGEFTLQLPFKVEIIHLIECEDYHATERLFHIGFNYCHTNGEWFLLSDGALNCIQLWDVFTEADLADYFRFSNQEIQESFQAHDKVTGEYLARGVWI